MTATTQAQYDYKARITWAGNRGEGTASYTSYGRDYRVEVDGKPDFVGSADPAFRGDPSRWNPEDQFLSALSSCHLLTFLALAARRGIQVVAYDDEAFGRLALDGRGGGRFEEIVLRPRVILSESSTKFVSDLAALHELAHGLCFLANSCAVPIRIEPRS
jgi:organic hydroperoxide reductase OsmC/OhrA